jgi:hypothetical protein
MADGKMAKTSSWALSADLNAGGKKNSQLLGNTELEAQP